MTLKTFYLRLLNYYLRKGNNLLLIIIIIIIIIYFSHSESVRIIAHYPTNPTINSVQLCKHYLPNKASHWNFSLLSSIVVRRWTWNIRVPVPFKTTIARLIRISWTNSASKCVNNKTSFTIIYLSEFPPSPPSKSNWTLITKNYLKNILLTVVNVFKFF